MPFCFRRIRQVAGARCWPKSFSIESSERRRICGPTARWSCISSSTPEIEGRFAGIYRDIDLPLSDVLRRMEKTGIRVEPSQLVTVIRTHGRRNAAARRRKFTRLPVRPFNINSPQQLAKVLYEDLKLPSPVKYGKGKTTSTAADILEALGGRTRDRAACPRIPAIGQAQRHICGRLAGFDSQRLRTRSHDVQSDRRCNRPAVVLQSESAEHSHPNANSAARFGRRSFPKTAGRWSSPTTRKLSFGCWRTCRKTRFWSAPSGTARTSTHARRPRCLERRR